MLSCPKTILQEDFPNKFQVVNIAGTVVNMSGLYILGLIKKIDFIFFINLHISMSNVIKNQKSK